MTAEVHESLKATQYNSTSFDFNVCFTDAVLSSAFPFDSFLCDTSFDNCWFARALN